MRENRVKENYEKMFWGGGQELLLFKSISCCGGTIFL